MSVLWYLVAGHEELFIADTRYNGRWWPQPKCFLNHTIRILELGHVLVGDYCSSAYFRVDLFFQSFVLEVNCTDYFKVSQYFVFLLNKAAPLPCFRVPAQLEKGKRQTIRRCFLPGVEERYEIVN